MKLFEHQPHPHTPKNVNDLHKEERQNINDKLAVLITKAFGSMPALYVLIAWMFGWMILSGLNFWLFANDKFPYPFLLFCSNLVQLWALPAIMVGQNVLNRKTELQANEDYLINQKSFHDLEEIMLHLEKQDEELLKQSHTLEQLLIGKKEG